MNKQETLEEAAERLFPDSSVQKRIFLEAGNSLNSLAVDWETGEIVGWSDEAIEAYNRYGDRIGWRQEKSWLDYWKGSTQNLEKDGHFPYHSDFLNTEPHWELFFLQRLVDCNR